MPAYFSPAHTRSIFFVRHGQSSSNAGALSVPHAEVPLTATGHAQAAAIAPLLPAAPALVLTSPYVRAQQTAAPYCARCGAAAQPVALLHEFDAIAFHLIAGMDGDARRPVTAAFWAKSDPLHRTGADKESFVQFACRVRAFVHHLLPALPHGTVAFGHGTWIAMLIWLLLGFDPLQEHGMRRFRSFQQGLPMPNASIWHIQGNGSGTWCAQVQEDNIRTVMTSVGM